MQAKSFKQMIQAGEVKRADAMKVALDDIHEEPGFNLRVEGPELDAHIRNLAQYIAAGGIVPALEVRPRPAGGVFVVDGHCRRRAYIMARDELGAPIEWVNIAAFTGNDADRVARIMTSQEGRKLEPLEVAMGYKRLLAFDKTPDEIAAMVGKSRQHVDQLLILANANSDVQGMVKRGEVSGATAVKVVRERGEDAGKVLQQELDKAKANGKAKVTPGTIKGKSLPAPILNEVLECAEFVVEKLTMASRNMLEGIRTGRLDKSMPVELPGSALLELLEAVERAKGKREAMDKRQAAKAAKQQQGERATA